MMNIIFQLKDIVIVKKMSKGFMNDFISSGHAWKIIKDGHQFPNKFVAIEFCKRQFLEKETPYFFFKKYQDETSDRMRMMSTYFQEEQNID